jgi:tripartite-type tricarboxylate transporter receptor subunit TctC
MNMYLQKNFPYDPKRAFAPITLAASAPLFLVVSTSLPVKTVAELVNYAKQRPGMLSYGSAGVGTGHHIVGEWIKKEAGIDMVHIPYRGSAPIVQDLISKEIQVGFGTLPSIIPAVDLGAVRILAVAEGKRYSELPDVPTIAETLPSITFGAWYGVFAPAGTPRAVVDRLNKAMLTALKNPASVAKFKAQGVVPVGSTPEELANRIGIELELWSRVVPSIGLKPE